MHVDNQKRNLGHRRPANRFGLERNARAGAARDGKVAGIGKAERERDRAEFVLRLDEEAAIFRQLAPERFHDRRPGCDRITGAVAHAAGDQAVGERLVAIHCDLIRCAWLFGDVLKLILLSEHVTDRVGVTRRECHDCSVRDALVLARRIFL